MAKIVIAPDSFKGTVTAVECAEALANGWRSRRPDDDVIALPLADGGEGTLDSVERAVPGSRRMPVHATGPRGASVAPSWLLLPDATGVVELATTCGLHLGSDNPLHSSTRAFGDAIVDALDHGVDRLLLAIGGSASTDGGAGVLSALGALLVQADGTQVPDGGAALLDVQEVDRSGLRGVPPKGALILSDVRNPLTGPAGAAHVFGPQKGAGLAEVLLLDRALQHWATLWPEVDANGDGTGAAGGTGFGLLAWGAELVSGAECVLHFTRFEDHLADAACVITGEGSFDEQTLGGKLVDHVLSVARRRGADAMLVAGRVAASPAGFVDHVELSSLAGSRNEAMSRPRRWLTRAGAELAERFSRSENAESRRSERHESLQNG